MLSGRVSDRNGPWLASALGELGIDPAHTTIVGDRPADMLAALSGRRRWGSSLIVTSGGLGPTADDLTATVVGEFCGREMVLDAALEERIADDPAPRAAAGGSGPRRRSARPTASRPSFRRGRRCSSRSAPRPDSSCAPAEGRAGPTVVVLPGPPRELQPLWELATRPRPSPHATRDATVYEQRVLRLFGLPESEIATTLREAQAAGVELERFEVTTCVRRGELEIVTRYEPPEREIAAALEAVIRERHARALYSDDGSGVDEQVAAALIERGLTVAVAESCTGGLMLARLTDRPGSSAFLRGGIVAYSNQVKVALAGVPAELIERHGAVSGRWQSPSPPGRASTSAPTSGSASRAWPGLAAAPPRSRWAWSGSRSPAPDGMAMVRRTEQRGTRADVRERTVITAMHLLRRLLSGAAGEPEA